MSHFFLLGMKILAKTPKLSPSEAMRGTFRVWEYQASKMAQEGAGIRSSGSFSLFIVCTTVVRHGDYASGDRDSQDFTKSKNLHSTSHISPDAVWQAQLSFPF